MTQNKYAAEIRVRLLDRKPINGIDDSVDFNVGDFALTMKLFEKTQILSLIASGFATEDEAKRFVPKLIRGLYNMALENDIAFEPTFDELDVTRGNDPEMAAKFFFGGSEGAPDRVHGIVGGQGYYVYKEDEKILVLTGGMLPITVSQDWTYVASSIINGISSSDREPSEPSDAIKSALDLYLAHFRETTIRAKLLTLVSSLEVLSQRSERPKEVRNCIKEFAGTLKVKGAEENESALKGGFLRAANFLQSNAEQESIKEAVRRSAKGIARGSEAERLEFVREVARAYDIRSKLSHGEDVSTGKVDAAFKVVQNAVRLMLKRAIVTKEDISLDG